MRVLFLVSDAGWSARARAFLLAARGLAARGHDVMLACESESPVQRRAAEAGVPVLSLPSDASTAGDTMSLRRTLKDRGVDAVFVHTDREFLMASSAVRLGRGSGAVIRRVPPFALASQGRGARLATRIAHTKILYATAADRTAGDAAGLRVPTAVAPLGIDAAEHEKTPVIDRTSIGAPADSRLIVCVHGGDDGHRVLVVMRTLALLAPRHPGLHLAIVGAGPQDELRMHGAALGVNAMVSYLGARDDELSVIRAADVGWIAADTDAAAFAALDFMAFQIAVLAEGSPLTEHYVGDRAGGVLLAPGDPTTTAASVSAFLAKDEQRVAMGKAGHARLERDFSPDAMITGFEQAISGAGDRAKHPA